MEKSEKSKKSPKPEKEKKKPEKEKKESETEKDAPKARLSKKKKIIIISAVAAVVVAAVVVLCIFLIPEKAPNNDKMLETSPEVLELSDNQKKADVTAITGTYKDKKGITDKENHRIFDTGFKYKLGSKEVTIYNTGKKDSKGNILYTLNRTDEMGKLVYYTGVEKDGKLELKKTNAVPDYTTSENSKLTMGNRYTTTKTIEYKTKKDDKKKTTPKTSSNTFLTYAGGSNDDVFNKIIAVDGGYIAVSYSKSKNGIYSGASSSYKGWFSAVSKIGTDGKFQWTYTTGGNSNVMLRDVAQLNDGSIVAVGLTMATDTEAGKTGLSQATFIVKLDEDGKEVWTYSFPCNEEENGDEAYSVAATPDGGFLVGGEAESTTGFFKDADGNYKAYLFKFDKKGKIEWRKVLGGSKDNEIRGISVNENGEIFAACVTWSFDGNFKSLAEYKVVNKTPNSVIIKLNKDGGLIWSKNIASWGQCEFDSIAATSDGGCVVGGTISMIGQTYGTSITKCYGSTDGYVVRFSKDGQVYWSRNIGGTEADHLKGIAVSDDYIIVTGSTKSTNYTFAELISGGEYDGFVTVLNNSGETLFSNKIGAKADDVINSVCISDKGYVVAGYTMSSDGVFKDSKTGKMGEAFIASYNIVDKTPANAKK